MSIPSAVVFGAGSVGRGFLGQLFSESGYEVVFVDIAEPIVAALSRARSYRLRLVDNSSTQDISVHPVRALHAEDTPRVCEELARAHVAATAVGTRALSSIAPSVAAGIELREKHGIGAALNIIVCENLKDAAGVFRSRVDELLSPGARSYAREYVGFINTVVGRMIPPQEAGVRAGDAGLVVAEPYKVLPVDARGFKGPIPNVVGMKPCEEFAVYMSRKLWIHNCAHAMLGYLGYLRGYAYCHEALRETTILRVVELSLRESQCGIAAAHHVSEEWLRDHVTDLLRRFGNASLKDSVARLGRDPLRKLGPSDRLVGAARLTESTGVRPEGLSWGIAAGYCFDCPDDPLARSLQGLISTKGIAAAMLEVSSIRPDETLGGLVLDRYHLLRTGRWS